MKYTMKWLSDEEINTFKERGFETSLPFHSAYEAQEHINYLKELNNDPSCMVSVAGVYKVEHPNINVLFKYTVI